MLNEMDEEDRSVGQAKITTNSRRARTKCGYKLRTIQERNKYYSGDSTEGDQSKKVEEITQVLVILGMKIIKS